MDRSSDPIFELSHWAKAIQPGIMQKMLDTSANPNIISFSLGLPDPKLFPILEYQKSVCTILESGSKVLQYAPPIANLKQQIVKLMEKRKVICDESQIFLTAGAQQAVSLLSRLFMNNGSTIAAEKLTYPGFFQIVAPFAPKIVPIINHFQKGICLDSVEKALKDKENRPAFIYIIPEGHNPLGISLDDKKKQDLALLSRTYRVPIIEDDAYGLLYYDSLTAPIRAYEDRWVFYVGTFSKTIAPSLRVGWIIVPKELTIPLAFLKEASDINTATFGQRIVSHYLENNNFTEHLNKIRLVYRERRDVMMRALKQYFPTEAKMSNTAHGFFIWVELPQELNSTNIFYKALKENVAFMPSEVFSVNFEQPSTNGLRLNFSHSEPEVIERGIKKLGEIIRSEITCGSEAVE